MDLPAPRSRGCTPQARLGGQLLEGTGHYGFIYRFMGEERPARRPLHTTTGMAGGARALSPLLSKPRNAFALGAQGSHH